jgi:hypothetical protein
MMLHGGTYKAPKIYISRPRDWQICARLQQPGPAFCRPLVLNM